MEPYRYCDCRRLLLGAQQCLCKSSSDTQTLHMPNDDRKPVLMTAEVVSTRVLQRARSEILDQRNPSIEPAEFIADASV